MRRKLKIVAELPAPAGDQLDEQIGFLLRVAMQRHTAIFTARMIEGLTQTSSPRWPSSTRSGPPRRITSAG